MSALDVLTALLLAAALFFFVAGTIGLLRFPDLYSRLHALTKADNAGLGLTVVPWIIAHQERGGNLTYREIADLPDRAVAGREVFLVERRDAARSGVTQIVVDLIDRHLDASTAYNEKT